MRRQLVAAFFVGGVVLVGLAPCAWAVITKPLPLQDLIHDESHSIFLVKIERVDPDRPSMVLKVSEHLKGKPALERMAVNLEGDKESDKEKHRPKLLKRIAPDVEMIVFVNKQEDGKLMALAFTNGTWLQMIGYPDGEKYRWAFTHCEVYLRRTYRGTTGELKAVVADVLAGKKRAPPYDPKVPIGFGPELETKSKEKE